MKIEILYKYGKMVRTEYLPEFKDEKRFWQYTAKDHGSLGKVAKEAIDAFYKYANKEKIGGVILSVTFLDFI